MTIDHHIATPHGSVAAHTPALAEATAALISGLRRLSTPDDLATAIAWDMDDWPSVPD